MVRIFATTHHFAILLDKLLLFDQRLSGLLCSLTANQESEPFWLGPWVLLQES